MAIYIDYICLMRDILDILEGVSVSLSVLCVKKLRFS